MHRPLALRPEILHRLHQPLAKEHLPHPVGLHARRQRVAAVHQPPCQPQPVPRPLRRHGRQERGRRRLHRVPLRVVGAALQDVRLPLRPLLHHHDGGNRRVVLVPFHLRLVARLHGGTGLGVHRQGQKRQVQLRLLRRRALLLRHLRHSGQRLSNVRRYRFFLRQRAVVDTHIANGAREPQPAAGAHHKRHLRVKRIRQLVEGRFNRRRFPVDPDPNPLRLPVPVVSKGDVLPGPQLHLLHRLQPHRNVGVAQRGDEVDIPVLQVQPVAGPFPIILMPRQNRARPALRLDPNRKAVGRHVVELRLVARV